MSTFTCWLIIRRRWPYPLKQLLTEDGLVMIHGLSTTDIDSLAAPGGGREFIQRYVFPHGELVQLSTVVRAMQEGGLEALDIENLRALDRQFRNQYRAHQNADRPESISDLGRLPCRLHPRIRPRAVDRCCGGMCCDFSP
jgi:cyclopropane fatty-acyl-phospholipid synthase-like methyltransferase